jgi:enoyl-CoA hydratase/carnithine racemase
MTLHRLAIEQIADDLRVGPPVPAWARPDTPNIVAVAIDASPAEVSAASDVPDLVVPVRLAAVVVAVASAVTAPPAWCDVLVDEGSLELERINRIVHDTPIAATALVQLLRGAEHRSMDDGLQLESALYSTLQAGPEFARWRAARDVRRRAEVDEPAVLVERDDDTLVISLNRPHVHNALNARMRDELLEALDIARTDPDIGMVELTGVGSSYCSGGDLDEFGSFADPASAHLVRTSAAIGPVLAALGDRVHVRLHGACFGSGVELPAFAARVSADDDTRISLPELSLGLIPGAGGTWSIPQRIGRHRTALMALTGDEIDAVTAASWGLVDERSGA